MAGRNGAIINDVYMANIYPANGGYSTGQVGSPMNDQSVMGSSVSMAAPSGGGMATTNEVSQAVAVGGMGSALTWWITIAVMLFLLMFVAKRYGSEGGEFSNIKLSAYNILVISFAAIIGLSFWKAFATKVKVPGLSTVILAA